MASSIRRRTGSRNSHERAGVSPCKCNSHKSTNVFAGCRGKELVRLTSVLAIDVDAGTETRIPRPKRSTEAPGGGGLKALKAATDATAGALVQVKREKEALEDRLLCTICMEADAPRAVVFGPCDHFLACASCAEKLAECPNCRATITTRTTIANSS